MRLTVIGCYGPYPAAGQCCSGYLVEDQGTAILLDCGNGVLGRLRYYVEPWDLDAVILSHLHSDHISDLMVMRYAILLRKLQSGKGLLHVYAPQDPAEEFQRLNYKDLVVACPVSVDSRLSVGSLKVTFSPAVHAFTSHVITVECGNKKLVYSGDTEYFPRLAELAAGADLFLCEANYLREDIKNGSPNHLAAYQAGKTARDAGVKRLVLTHHHPERDLEKTRAEASEYFADVELASAGAVYFL